MTQDEIDVFQSLFGDEAVEIHWDTGESRDVNGVWRGPNGYQNMRLSGVLTFMGLRPTLIGSVEPTLWHHPRAYHPLNRDNWIFRQQVVSSETGHIQVIDGAASVLDYLHVDGRKFKELLIE
jgi:hypothetical protein